MAGTIMAALKRLFPLEAFPCCNFSNYVHRFSMPNGESNLFYSFDLGPAHFVAFSTEFYFYVKYGWSQIVNQFQWLNEDLKKANLNRKNVPWIITMGHRPMYCSNWDSDDCTKYESIIRGGLPYIHAYALEPLFYKYGVDLCFWAHEHSYERMYPLYNRTVYNSSNDPYLNPQAPVHIITGSAGCQENTDAFVPSPPPWSAFRSSEYGYSRMTIHNASHLYLEQISDDRNGQPIDKMWLRKQSQGSYLRFDQKSRDLGHHVPYDIEPPAWYKGRCVQCSQL
uniref:Purple acid phosphatase n=1 Tax=Romanomermis culicivorax TaxID=13658 RepID=A0A915K6D4_ROMCU